MVVLFWPKDGGIHMIWSLAAFVLSAAGFGCIWQKAWDDREYSSYRILVMRRWKKVLPSNVWM
jgi:hypothetical protein